MNKKYVVDTFDKNKKWEGWMDGEFSSLKEVEKAVDEDMKKDWVSAYYVVSDENKFLFSYEIVEGKKIRVDF